MQAMPKAAPSWLHNHNRAQYTAHSTLHSHNICYILHFTEFNKMLHNILLHCAADSAVQSTLCEEVLKWKQTRGHLLWQGKTHTIWIIVLLSAALKISFKSTSFLLVIIHAFSLQLLLVWRSKNLAKGRIALEASHLLFDHVHRLSLFSKKMIQQMIRGTKALDWGQSPL